MQTDTELLYEYNNMRRNADYFKVPYALHTETDKAFGFNQADDNKQDDIVWLPKSQCVKCYLPGNKTAYFCKNWMFPNFK